MLQWLELGDTCAVVDTQWPLLVCHVSCLVRRRACVEAHRPDSTPRLRMFHWSLKSVATEWIVQTALALICVHLVRSYLWNCFVYVANAPNLRYRKHSWALVDSFFLIDKLINNNFDLAEFSEISLAEFMVLQVLKLGEPFVVNVFFWLMSRHVDLLIFKFQLECASVINHTRLNFYFLIENMRLPFWSCM